MRQLARFKAEPVEPRPRDGRRPVALFAPSRTTSASSASGGACGWSRCRPVRGGRVVSPLLMTRAAVEGIRRHAAREGHRRAPPGVPRLRGAHQRVLSVEAARMSRPFSAACAPAWPPGSTAHAAAPRCACRRPHRLAAPAAVHRHAPRLPGGVVGRRQRDRAGRGRSRCMRCACSRSPASTTATSRTTRSAPRARCSSCSRCSARSAAQRGPLWWASHHRHHHVHADEHEDSHSAAAPRLLVEPHGLVHDARATSHRAARWCPTWRAIPELRFLDRFDALVPLLLRVAAVRCRRAGSSARAGARHERRAAAGVGLLRLDRRAVPRHLHASTRSRTASARAATTRATTAATTRWLALLTFGEGWHNNHHHYPGVGAPGLLLVGDRPHLLRAARCWQRCGIVWDLRAGAGRGARRAPARAGARRMKIAIVGTGIAGNVVAHRLHRAARHHACTRPAATSAATRTRTAIELDGEVQHVDTGFIVFNDCTYPHFIALLDELGVASQPSAMSFSVRNERSGLEYNGTSLNALFAQRRNLLRPSFLRMMRDILRFNREAPRAARRRRPRDRRSATTSHEQRYSRRVHRRLPGADGRGDLVDRPAAHARVSRRASSCASCTTTACCSVNDRPEWRVIQRRLGALRRAAGRAVARPHARWTAPVDAGAAATDGVLVSARGRADRALRPRVPRLPRRPGAARCWPTRRRAEREVLGAMPYPAQRGRAAHRHVAAAAAPAARGRRGTTTCCREPAQRVALTYNMNILQGLELAPHVLRDAEPQRRDRSARRAAAADATTIRCSRPPASPRRRATTRSAACSARYYCGAYWRYGFHEDGVRQRARRRCSASSERRTHAQRDLPRVA